MSKLDKDYLLSLKVQATEQRQKYWEMVQQANGAIAMVDVLLTELQRQDPPDTENQNGINAI